MKISANDIRSGNILDYQGGLWLVIKNPDRIKPGKGGAYVQVEMKNIDTGTKLNKRFSSSDKVEKAFLDGREMQYLYREGDHVIFMDTQSFEQIHVDIKLVGERLPFLTESLDIRIDFFRDKPVRITLPQSVIVEIMETEPMIKGATVTSSYKPAILTNSIKVMVPSYIKSGEKILIKMEDLSFVERIKN